jgi:hypothetical protein
MYAQIAVADGGAARSAENFENRSQEARVTADTAFRARLAEAFQALGVGTEETIAYRRTKDFYRRSEGSWTENL